jgi:hypothetical protein
MTISVATAVLAALCLGCRETPSSRAGSSAASPVSRTEGASLPAEAPPAGHGATTANAATGRIAETMDSGGYTYVRLQQTGKDDVWVAAPEFDAGVGEEITVSLDMPMQGFTSKTLNRTFPLLYFVQEVARDGRSLGSAAESAMPEMMTGHGPSETASQAEPIGTPQGGMSVADVFAKKGSFAGKPVVVRGRVVKFNGGILDRNWLHIQDGSGTAAAHDNDLTVTTDAEVRVGDVVTVSGVLATGKDFGAGYAYDAIVENASIAPR